MTNVPVTVVFVGKEYGLTSGGTISDVHSVNLDFSGLRIVLETAPSGSLEKLFLEYFFPNYYGFRLLEEIDLQNYWKEKIFSTRHHLYEIKEGGWLNQEVQYGEFSRSSEHVKEWFIKTSNASLNILAQHPPLIREFIR